MDWNLRKLWPAAAASLVAFTSFVNAADDTQMRNLENRVSALEQRKGSNGMINPPARPVVKDGVDIFVEGSALWWQASESGLDYALSWNNDIPVGTASPDFGGRGKFHHPKFKWDWGFKIGAGYNMMHDGWDLYLDWTRFHTRSSHGHCGGCAGTTTSVTPFVPGDNPTSVVYPLLFPASLIPGNADDAGTGCCSENIGPGYLACMDWRMRLDMVDLELGREFFVSKWLTLRPYAGIRAAWVRQRGVVTYQGNIISSTPAPGVAANFDVNLKNNFWGVGPRIGLDAQWGLGAGFSIYSDLGISVVLGKFKIRESQSPTLVPVGTATAPAGATTSTGTMTFGEKYTAARAITDLAIGFRYGTSFCDDAYGLTLQVGWEQHMFFSQNQLQRLARNNAPNGLLTQQNRNAFTPVTNQGDLSTQGVTFTARVDF